MTDTAAWTIGRLLRWTADYLEDHGAESPRLDAEVLLAHARGCERIELYTCFDEVANESVRREFRAMVKQRAGGTPVAYLVGHREFYSKSFLVTPDVLIPRPETEFVLIGLFDLIKSHGQTTDKLRLIDVGTGSGILAICAAAELPSAEVVATDISDAALQVAASNAERHGVSDRVEFVNADLLAGIEGVHRFHYIISNPPYVAVREKASLQPEVVGAEPHEALFAGEDGLEILTRLIAQAPRVLEPGGWLLTELDPRQVEDVRRLVAQQAEFESPEFAEDLTRRPRVMKVRRRPAPSTH